MLWMLFKMKLSRNMAFRFNFFGAFFVDGSLFLVQLLTFSAIYQNAGSIGGFSQGEMTIFIGTFSLINALNMVIFFFGINPIPEKILNGDLDLYLTKPMNPLLRLSFESIDFGSLPLIPLSILIIISGVKTLPVAPNGGQVVLYGLMVIIMTVLWYDIVVLIRTVPFYFPSAKRIDRIEELLALCFKVPGTLFHGAWKVLFYFVVPYGIMATMPAQLLAGALTPLGFAYGIAIVALFTFLALTAWKKGLKRYASASS